MKYVVEIQEEIPKDTYTIEPAYIEDTVGIPELVIIKTTCHQTVIFSNEEDAKNFSKSNGPRVIKEYVVSDDHFNDVHVDIKRVN